MSANTDAGKIAVALSFFSSVIKCGEPWTDVCQERLNDAFDALARLGEQAAESDRLRAALGAIVQWHQNWDAPFHDEDEWQGDFQLAKEALGLVPRASEQSAPAGRED